MAGADIEPIYVDCKRVITILLKGGRRYDVQAGTFRVCRQFGFINPGDYHGDSFTYTLADPLFQRVERVVPDSEWKTYSHEYSDQPPLAFTCLAEELDDWDGEGDPNTFRVTGLVSSIVAVETDF
jgi:hypothetical protein